MDEPPPSPPPQEHTNASPVATPASPHLSPDPSPDPGLIKELTAIQPRKTIRSFLASEKGGITKKALVDSAVAAGFIFSLSSAVSAQVTHSNALSLTGIDQPAATGKHSHHSSHASHSSHSSY